MSRALETLRNRWRRKVKIPTGGKTKIEQLAEAGISASAAQRYEELAVPLERLSVRGRFKRQPHVKLCAIRTCAEVDFSVMPFDDDPVADNQAEPRA
jgi:hypothetical protein